ncbi:NAD(P)H-dependent oxidoreductase [Epilithonimonas sp.]|uniref:NAD(P)H-dependent oxidoreductase n=1 Tax=Epilithonimonas sp. TaxID=2894511 RepID=UPI00289DD39D|nr:NAD(P)H-dependent oxidoreductase [Epilithonimonas sp.]
MKHLIIYSHPNPNSINSQFKQMLVEFLWDNGHEVIVRDLNKLDFNPILSLEDMEGQRMGRVADDVTQEQNYISWAEHITFIYPIWWTGMPAVMKGFIDRVFSYGFAYRYDQGVQKGLLTGKHATIINTHGKSRAEYESIGMDKALSLTSDKGVFTYCGFEINQHFFFDKADKADPEIIKDWKQQIIKTFKSNSTTIKI